MYLARLFPLVFFFLLSACTGGEGAGPDAGHWDDSGGLLAGCPDTPIAAGDSCAIAPELRCPRAVDDCGLMQLCSCDPDTGRYVCEDVDFSASCAGLQGVSCSVEGTGTCDVEPAGGSWTCSDDAWQFSSGCPEGCPSIVPPDGAVSCTLDGQTVCRYQEASSQCTCVDGTFRC